MVIIEGRTIGVSGCATTKRERASSAGFSRRVHRELKKKKNRAETRVGPPIAPGRFPEFPCARGAQSAESSRGWGATAVPEDASTARTRHVTPACGVLIGRGPCASPMGARAPRASARGARRRPPARREMGTADRPQSAAVSVGTARSRRAGTRAARRRTMRCKAKVDAACAASVRESLRKRRDAKWGCRRTILLVKSALDERGI